MVEGPRPWIVNMTVTIRGWTGHYLSNKEGANPCFFNNQRNLRERWIIRLSGPNSYIIKSPVDGRNLEVGPDGFIQMCHGEANEAQWDIIPDQSVGDVFYLRSCGTGKNLQCNNYN